MVDEKALKELFTRQESPILDFKRDIYRFDTDYHISEFLKDILAMANTRRDEPAYIILGVKAYPDGRKYFIGLTGHLDDNEFQNQLLNKKAKIDPRPHFLYQPIALEGKIFGVIEIPVVNTGPFYANGDLEVIKSNGIYFRRGTQNAPASHAEQSEIYHWFHQLSSSSQSLKSEPNLFEKQLEDFATPIIEKIKSRSYWRVVVRPRKFLKERVKNLSSLYPIIQQTSVGLSGWGWNLPHLEETKPKLGLDWVGQETDITFPDSIIESWRFYQSGQFMQFGNNRADWQKEAQHFGRSALSDVEPGKILLADEMVAVLTKVFQFAANLVIKEIYSQNETIEIEFKIDHLMGRFLLPENRNWMMPFIERERKADIDTYEYQMTEEGVELIKQPNEEAIVFINHLFQRFGMASNEAIIRSMQAFFLKRP